MAAKILKKNSDGYNYKYLDLNRLLAWLDEQGISVTQEVKVIDGNDYILSHYEAEGKQWDMLGCRVVMPKSMGGGKVNECQQYGSAISYAKRYSICMNLGISTSDDDAACCDVSFPQTQEEMLVVLKELTEKDASKKTAMPILKKKLGIDKPAKECTYEELKTLYQTLCS